MFRGHPSPLPVPGPPVPEPSIPGRLCRNGLCRGRLRRTEKGRTPDAQSNSTPYHGAFTSALFASLRVFMASPNLLPAEAMPPMSVEPASHGPARRSKPLFDPTQKGNPEPHTRSSLEGGGDLSFFCMSFCAILPAGKAFMEAAGTSVVLLKEGRWCMEYMIALVAIDLFVCLSILAYSTFHLFVQKRRFFWISIFSTWAIEFSANYIFDQVVNTLFDFLTFFPCLCLLILYLLGKIFHISFLIKEYIFIYITYTLSQFILIYITILIYLMLGIGI